MSIPEPDDSTDDVSNESSEYEDSDEIKYYSVPYGHIFLPSLHPYGHVRLPFLHKYDVMCFPNLPYPCLSFSSHQKLVNADFCQNEIKEPGNDRIFSYHPLLKTHSNQEHDNAIHHPSLSDIIKKTC